MKDIPRHMRRPANPVTHDNGGDYSTGLTKLEYAAVHIAAGIRAAESTVVSEGRSMSSVDLARMALDDAQAVLSLIDTVTTTGY